MKSTTIRTVVIASLLVASASMVVYPQQNETINDKDIKVVKFVELRYPQLARTAHVQGLVVVRVRLNDEGDVADAVAISGADVLVRECVANAKKWKFQPNSSRTAVIIYQFKLPPADCGSVESFFTLEGVNLAKVTACPLTVQTVH